jgi:hypothetical protein
MICSCPKCHIDIDVDLAQIPEQGANPACPECKSRFWVSQEPFALRAFKKEGKIYCLECDRELGVLNFCQGCKAQYPGYWVVQSTRPVRRRIEKPAFSINLLPKPQKKARVIAETISSGDGVGRPILAKVGGLALALMLVVAAGVYFVNSKLEREYSENFVIAVYGIKSGTDRSLKNFSSVVADWQSKTFTGGNFNLSVTSKEEADLRTIKNEIDQIMAKLDSPPPKFSQTNEKLTRLYTFYTQLHALNLNPPKSYVEFTDSVSRIEKNFDLTARELKTTLPGELAEELLKAGTKYKNLKFIIDS